MEEKKKEKKHLYSVEWYSDIFGISIASGYIVATNESDAQDRAIDDVFDMAVRGDGWDPERDATECWATELSMDTAKRVLDMIIQRKKRMLEETNELIRIEIDLEEVLG